MKYIDIEDDNGNKTEMEVLSIFRLDNYVDNYIIYCDKKRSHFYVAKFNNNDLDTNLSEEEYKLCDDYFKEVIV